MLHSFPPPHHSLVTLIPFGIAHRLWSYSLQAYNCIMPPVTSNNLVPNIPLSTLFFSKNLTRGPICSYLKLVDQLSHTCKTAAKVTVLFILIFRTYDFRQQTKRQKMVNWNVVSTCQTAWAFTFFVNELVPRCWYCFPTTSSLATLSVVISRRYRIFLPACVTVCEGLCSVTVLFGCPLKFSFRLGVLKHVLASVTVGRGGLAGVARTWVFLCLVD